MQTWKSKDEAKEAFYRWQTGNTGCGLVDASQRELVLTGYTSNRARQNVASYLAKRLYIDWRLGAEWYDYAFSYPFDMINLTFFLGMNKI